MTRTRPAGVAVALAALAAGVVAGATACSGGGHHAHRLALPSGPQEMTATVDAVRLSASGGCEHVRVGAGLTDGHYVLTSATLAAGATTVAVTNGQGKQVSGRVVALDPEADVAWVYAPGLPSVQIAPATSTDRVVPAYVFGFTADGRPVTYRAQTLERLSTTVRDVFGHRDVRREVYRLHLDEQPTALVAGAPVLDSSGHLLGIVTGGTVTGGTVTGDRTLDAVAGDVVARSAATRSLSGHDPATMATSAGSTCAAAVSSSS